MKFYIPVSWHQRGFHVIEADNLEQAQERADDCSTLTLTGESIDTLPPPCQEEWNDDYTINVDEIREATPDEIKRAEMPSAPEALRVALEALRLTSQRIDSALRPTVTEAIAAAEKALGGV